MFSKQVAAFMALELVQSNQMPFSNDSLMDSIKLNDDAISLFDKTPKRYGGGGGDPFDYKPINDDWYTSDLFVCVHSRVTSFGIKNTNLKTKEIQTFGNWNDRSGQTCTHVQVKNYPHDCINAVDVKTGHYVDHFVFHRRDGTSDKIGGNGGDSLHEVSFGEDACLSGVYGGQGGSLDGAGFYYTDIPPSQLSYDFTDTPLWGENGRHVFKLTPPINEYGTQSGYDMSWKLQKIDMQQGALIDGITLWYKSEDGTIMESGHVGGTGGSFDTWTIADDDCINKVKAGAGDNVDGVTFYTKNGRSKHFGGRGGDIKTFDFGEGCVVGIHGKVNQFISSIGFIYATPSNETSMLYI